MRNLSGINKIIRLPNTTIMNFFVQLFFFKECLPGFYNNTFITAASLMNLFHVWKKMCFCEKHLSLNAENANAIDKLYNYMYIFIYLFNFFFWWKKNSVFLGENILSKKKFNWPMNLKSHRTTADRWAKFILFWVV